MLNEKPSMTRFTLYFICVCAILCCAVLAFHVWFVRNYTLVEIDGESMRETLQDGDFLYIRLTGEAERGDIVVLDVSSLVGTNSTYIKRLIATEGDTVYCEEGIVYIRYAGEDEFTALEEPYTRGTTHSFDPVEVGEGEVFFLGDNRGNSKDSIVLGCIEGSAIVGVVPDWSLRCKGAVTGLYRTIGNIQEGLTGLFG